MTPEETLIFLVYTGALMARKSVKYIHIVADAKWINDLYGVQKWLHQRDLGL